MQARLAVLKQLCLDYLMLYPPYREGKRFSTHNVIKYNLELMASYLTRVEPVDDQLDKALKEIAGEIKTANTFDEFYKLIPHLRQKAEKAKSLKSSIALEESKLFEHFHAVADLIICELAETIQFKIKISELEEKLRRATKSVNDCLEKHQGKGIEDVNKESDTVIKNVTLELAQLGIIKYINSARLQPLPAAKDLVDLECVETASYAAPIYLQKIYCKQLYIIRYQPMMKIDFDRFKQRATEKVTAAEKEITTEKSHCNGQNDSPPSSTTKLGTSSNSGVFSQSKPKLTKSKSNEDIVKNKANEPSVSQQESRMVRSKQN